MTHCDNGSGVDAELARLGELPHEWVVRDAGDRVVRGGFGSFDAANGWAARTEGRDVPDASRLRVETRDGRSLDEVLAGAKPGTGASSPPADPGDRSQGYEIFLVLDFQAEKDLAAKAREWGWEAGLGQMLSAAEVTPNGKARLFHWKCLGWPVGNPLVSLVKNFMRECEAGRPEAFRFVRIGERHGDVAQRGACDAWDLRVEIPRPVVTVRDNCENCAQGPSAAPGA
jgi:hypothetical protein